jgi:alpha-beta hydrolase superfamily lysophospholipase
MRGHGRTADLALNRAADGGLIGHCADTGAAAKIVRDIDGINTAIKKERPGVPVFILGHSWGSFLVQLYIETFSANVDGCILSGTRGPGGIDTAFGAIFLPLYTMVCSPRTRSRFILKLAKGNYNKAFMPARTAIDWCSRDSLEVDKFLADPLCQHLSSAGFYRDMVTLLIKIGKASEMKKIRRDLPVYIFSGNADPVGKMGAGPSKLVRKYKNLGITDIEYVLYPGARHEVLHETNRGEAVLNLIKWLDAHIESRLS